MWQIGIGERDAGLAERVSRLADGLPALVRACRHPALLAGVTLDLLVVTPGASGWAGAGALSCRTALLPGGRSALTRDLPAETLISYGASGRNTLTLSSRDEFLASVAVQREFLSLEGKAVDRQEIILPRGELSPDLLLAEAGAALLLGRLPEEEARRSGLQKG